MSKFCISPEKVEEIKRKVKEGEMTEKDIYALLPEEKSIVKGALEEIIAEKLKVKVTSEEVSKLTKQAQKIDEAYKKLGNDLGNPTKLKENLDFFRERSKMDKLIAGFEPSSNLRILTGTIGRGMMLFSVKSPVINIVSNAEVAFTEALSRRLVDGIKTTDNKLAGDYVRFVNKIYRETGYDISRMESIEDAGVGGERVMGDIVSSEGPGKVRQAGRVIENIVFKYLMGAPDVAFSAAHFADSVNLNAQRIAKGNKTLGKESMLDAMTIDPKTDAGKALRKQAILDAQVATFTDKTWASRLSMGIRKLFNDWSGDLRAGDYLFPFVKTPANVIARGMDYAGVGFLKSAYKLSRMIRSGEYSRAEFRSIARDAVRSGMGIAFALIITSLLDDDDYVGAYDPSRSQIESLRNSNTNSIRIGNKWISTDYLSVLGVPVSAIMYARKYGKTGPEKTFKYSEGVLSEFKKLPGIEDVFDYVKADSYKKYGQTLEEMTGEAQDYFWNQLSARLVPSFIPDIAKAIDPYQRKTKGGFEAAQAKIPLLRQRLPEKKDIFGETMKAEPSWSTMLFGARLKTSTETKLIKEIETISRNVGKNPAFTDWNKTTSKKILKFKEIVGNKEFDKATIKYGKTLKNRLQTLFDSEEYKEASEDDKYAYIISEDTKARDDIFYEYADIINEKL